MKESKMYSLRFKYVISVVSTASGNSLLYFLNLRAIIIYMEEGMATNSNIPAWRIL